ncbi:MAG: hypothetical protein EBY39_10920 [Flavobacteriia bacterium]|nr:hypothetical protein [Flavobacteriia bacterium]
MRKFSLLVGATSLLIAGCAAYFSVRGIGLLFAGFMVPVMIMAGSLELGKLVTASFLYRRWKHIPIFMKTYLTAAVVTLILITSLGIYGYLSDAFTKTSTRVTLYESNISQLESKNKYLEEQIEGATSAASTVDDKANEAIANFQSIYDSFVTRQDKRKQTLVDRLAVLDEERNKLEASSGGLFSSKKKKLQELSEAQKDERTEIKNTLTQIDEESKKEYDSFLTKVDNLREKTGEVDVQKDVNEYYDQISLNDDKILEYKELIGNTDIGSFKFIAKTFGMELEQVVKWFMIVIVVVFDPLAVCLVIGYNSLLTPNKKNDSLVSEESNDSTTNTMDTPESLDPILQENFSGDLTREEVVEAVKIAPNPSQYKHKNSS